MPTIRKKLTINTTDQNHQCIFLVHLSCNDPVITPVLFIFLNRFTYKNFQFEVFSKFILYSLKFLKFYWFEVIDSKYLTRLLNHAINPRQASSWRNNNWILTWCFEGKWFIFIVNILIGNKVNTIFRLNFLFVWKWLWHKKIPS